MRFDKLINSTKNTSCGLHRGELFYDSESNLFLWNSPLEDYAFISETLGLTIDCSLGVMIAQPLTCKGYIYFKNDNFYLFRGEIGWIISLVLAGGYNEYWDDLEEEWAGDQWWWGGSSMEGEYQARGTLKNAGGVVNVSLLPVNGWKKPINSVGNRSYMLGEYQPSGSASGTKHVGWERLESDIGNILELKEQATSIPYQAQVEEDEQGRYLFQTSGGWYIGQEIGVANPKIGFWSSGTKYGAYNRTYTGGGTPPAPATINVAFKEYTLDDISENHSKPVYITRTTIW